MDLCDLLDVLPLEPFLEYPMTYCDTLGPNRNGGFFLPLQPQESGITTSSSNRDIPSLGVICKMLDESLRPHQKGTHRRVPIGQFHCVSDLYATCLQDARHCESLNSSHTDSDDGSENFYDCVSLRMFSSSEIVFPSIVSEDRELPFFAIIRSILKQSAADHQHNKQPKGVPQFVAFFHRALRRSVRVFDTAPLFRGVFNLNMNTSKATEAADDHNTRFTVASSLPEPAARRKCVVDKLLEHKADNGAWVVRTGVTLSNSDSDANSEPALVFCTYQNASGIAANRFLSAASLASQVILPPMPLLRVSSTRDVSFREFSGLGDATPPAVTDLVVRLVTYVPSPPIEANGNGRWWKSCAIA